VHAGNFRFYEGRQSLGALGTAALLVGHEHILRVDRPVSSGRFSLDSSGIDELEALGRFEARKALPRLKATFLAEHTPLFKPFEERVPVDLKCDSADF